MDKYTERNKERCDKENTESSHPKISGGPAYSLPYIQGYEGVKRERRAGARRSRHDIISRKWGLTIQLDDQGIWFLSVFVNDDESFDKFSLDHEEASDSHYEFRDEYPALI